MCSHRPLNHALIPTLSHLKSGCVTDQRRYIPMPPKPWPTSYLLKFWHDLTRLGRLPTCKSRNPLTVIHHITCTQMISIINYIFIHIISKFIQNYRLSIEYLCDIWYNKTKHDKKKQKMTPIDDCARFLHQATDLMSKVNRGHQWTYVS